MPRHHERSALGYDLDRELPFVEVDGVRYLLGTAGSLILACEWCGAEHFRDAGYFSHPEWETCFNCRPRVTMMPLPLSILDRWGAAFGFEPIPVEERRAERLRNEVARPWNHAFGPNARESDYPLGYREVSCSPV